MALTELYDPVQSEFSFNFSETTKHQTYLAPPKVLKDILTF